MLFPGSLLVLLEGILIAEKKINSGKDLLQTGRGGRVVQGLLS